MHGTVRAQPATGTLKDPLIVAYKDHYTFMPSNASMSPEYPSAPGVETTITHPSAHAYRVEDSGVFSIDLPADVVSVSLLFMAPGRLTRIFRYSRTLGLGRIRYLVELEAMPDWRSHYFTFLEPQLQHLIVEKRYRLSDRDQKLLADWLDRQKSALESASPKAIPGKTPPGHG